MTQLNLLTWEFQTDWKKQENIQVQQQLEQ